MIPIVLTTWNRPKLLRQCLDSLWQTVWPRGGFRLLVFDDGSTNAETVKMVEALRDHERVEFVRRELHTGMVWNTMWAIHWGMTEAHEGAIIKIEGDALFHPDWLGALEDLYYSLSTKSTVAQLSAFWWDGYGTVEEHARWRQANCVGGVATILNKQFWIKHRVGERTALGYGRDIHTGRARTSWPHYMTKAAEKDGAIIGALKPSYVQHLGTENGTSPSASRAIAPDFIGDAK